MEKTVTTLLEARMNFVQVHPPSSDTPSTVREPLLKDLEKIVKEAETLFNQLFSKNDLLAQRAKRTVEVYEFIDSLVRTDLEADIMRSRGKIRKAIDLVQEDIQTMVAAQMASSLTPYAYPTLKSLRSQQPQSHQNVRKRCSTLINPHNKELLSRICHLLGVEEKVAPELPLSPKECSIKPLQLTLRSCRIAPKKTYKQTPQCIEQALSLSPPRRQPLILAPTRRRTKCKVQKNPILQIEEPSLSASPSELMHHPRNVTRSPLQPASSEFEAPPFNKIGRKTLIRKIASIKASVSESNGINTETRLNHKGQEIISSFLSEQLENDGKTKEMDMSKANLSFSNTNLAEEMDIAELKQSATDFKNEDNFSISKIGSNSTDYKLSYSNKPMAFNLNQENNDQPNAANKTTNINKNETHIKEFLPDSNKIFLDKIESNKMDLVDINGKKTFRNLQLPQTSVYLLGENEHGYDSSDLLSNAIERPLLEKSQNVQSIQRIVENVLKELKTVPQKEEFLEGSMSSPDLSPKKCSPKLASLFELPTPPDLSVTEPCEKRILQSHQSQFYAPKLNSPELSLCKDENYVDESAESILTEFSATPIVLQRVKAKKDMVDHYTQITPSSISPSYNSTEREEYALISAEVLPFSSMGTFSEQESLTHIQATSLSEGEAFFHEGADDMENVYQAPNLSEGEVDSRDLIRLSGFSSALI